MRVSSVAFISLALLSSVYAEDHPLVVGKTWTVDMTTVLLDQDDQPIKDEFERKGATDCTACPNLTLGNAAAHALFFIGQDEKDVSPETKWAWSAWAMDIRKNKAVKLTAPESDLLYKRLGKLYGGIVLMRAMPLIDPNRKPPEIK